MVMESVVSQEGIFDTGFISCRYFQKKRCSVLSFNSEKKKRNFVLEKREGRGDTLRAPEMEKLRSSALPQHLWVRLEYPKHQPEISLNSLGWERGFCCFLNWDFENLLQILQFLTKGRENSSRRGRTAFFSGSAKKKTNYNLGLWDDCIFVLLLFSLSLPGEKFQEFFWVFSAFLQFD